MNPFPVVTVERVADRLRAGPATARQIADAIMRTHDGRAAGEHDVDRTKRALRALEAAGQAIRTKGSGLWTRQQAGTGSQAHAHVYTSAFASPYAAQDTSSSEAHSSASTSSKQ